MGDVILGWLKDAAFSLWAWLLSVSFGFIPTYVLVAILVAAAVVLYFMYGIKGLVGFGLVAVSVAELMRRAAIPYKPKEQPQWPDVVPKPRKPLPKPGQKRVLNKDGYWEYVDARTK